MAIRWRGVLLREGIETGDGRMIDRGATRWRELPRDLGCVFEEGSWGHENAVVVGVIETIERVGDDIMGDGLVLMANEDADRWVNMNRQGALRGCSVDLTGGEAIIEVVNRQSGEVLDPDIGIEVLWGPEGDEYRVRERWTDAEIGSTAVCRVPAFADALIEVYDDDEADAEVEGGDAPVIVEAGAGTTAAAREPATFAAIDDVSVGIEVTWVDPDGNSRTGQVVEVDEDAETVTVQEPAPEGEDDTPDPVTLPVAEVVIVTTDDEGDDDEGDDDAATQYGALRRRAASSTPARPALAALLARERGEPVTASVGTTVTAGGRRTAWGAVVQASVSWGDGPPLSAFARRVLDRPTPFTIDDDGTVHGHLRLNGQCHMGFMHGGASPCVTVPDSPSDYALFHANGQVRCDDGSRVAVGILAMDTTHAPAGRPGRRPSLASVQRWYQDTGMQACYLHAYDDEFGTQVCGILCDGITVEAARRAMASRPSGDWRDYGQGLDLTGIVLVNVPGYPVFEREDGADSIVLACLAPPPGVDLTAHTAAATAGGSCSGGCGCGGTCSGGAAARGGVLAGNRRARLAGVAAAFATAGAGSSTTDE